MATPVIKVARQGYDIRTADPKDLTLDSSKNQFKVHDEDGGTFEFAGSGAWTNQKLYVDITHNLGYQPSFIAQLKGPSGGWKVHPVLNNGTTGPTKWCSGIDRLDENTIRLYCYIYDPTLAAYSAFDVDYRYIIFVDPNKNVWS
jgi:hypothetical protein